MSKQKYGQKLLETVIASKLQSNRDKSTRWGGATGRRCVRSRWVILSKAATVQILRARSKCAVVTEEISGRGKLLKGVSASEAPEEPPVQVSAADSWGFPDIDLCFLIRVPSSTYSPTLRDWCVLQRRRGAGHWRTHIRVPHRIDCTLMFTISPQRESFRLITNFNVRNVISGNTTGL